MHDKVIIYLHGFNSSGGSGTATYLRSFFRESIVTPSYNYIDPIAAGVFLNDVVHQALADNKMVVMAGKSLGGFWANYFAEKYQLSCVLVNPSLDPATSLLKYVGDNINFNNGTKTVLTSTDVANYLPFYPCETPALQKIVLLGARDETVPPGNAILQLKGHTIKVYPHEGHQFNDHAAMGEAIRECLG